MDVEYREMSPSDAAVALRSFPRRYRALLLRPDVEDDPESIVTRKPASDRLSALEHAATAAAVLEVAAEDIERTLVQDRPNLGRPRPAPGRAAGLGATLERLDDAAGRLADLADRARGEEWSRTATVDGQPTRALTMLQRAVGDSARRLRDIEQVLAEVKGRPAPTWDDEE